MSTNIIPFLKIRESGIIVLYYWGMSLDTFKNDKSNFKSSESIFVSKSARLCIFIYFVSKLHEFIVNSVKLSIMFAI